MSFTNEQKIEQKYFTSYFQKKSRLQELFKSDSYEIDISNYSLKFRDLVLNHLRLNNFMNKNGALEKLHLCTEEKNYKYDKYDINPIQKSLYSITEKNRSLYYEFISKCLKEKFPFDFYFQKEITFRVHIPNPHRNLRTSPFPRFHMDSCLGHPPNEINIWIPLTKLDPKEMHSFNLASVFESKKLIEKFNYLPKSIDHFRKIKGKELDEELNHYEVTTEYGKALIFDARCMHSAMPVNFHTRISIDIRILPVEDFESLPYEFIGTGRMKTKWIPGHGYDILDSSKL